MALGFVSSPDFGRRLRSICLGVALLASQRSPARAEDDAPRQLVEQSVRDALAVLRDPALKDDAKRRMSALRNVVDRVFDWEGMARSSLGVPWRRIDDAQRRDFVSVFKELLAQRYMNDIDRFQGNEEILIQGSDAQPEFTVVKTVLITSSRERVPIDYTLQRQAGSWRVQDINIEGVSLVNHYRKTFANFLANKSFEALMNQLKRKLGVAAAPGPS